MSRPTPRNILIEHQSIDEGTFNLHLPGTAGSLRPRDNNLPYHNGERNYNANNTLIGSCARKENIKSWPLHSSSSKLPQSASSISHKDKLSLFSFLIGAHRHHKFAMIGHDFTTHCINMRMGSGVVEVIVGSSCGRYPLLSASKTHSRGNHRHRGCLCRPCI